MLTAPARWLARQQVDSPSLGFLTGCTACTVLVTPQDVVVANAGDSRCVLCRGGRAVALSRDHKPHLPEERVRIYAAHGYLELGRVNGNLNLSRALGDLMYKQDVTLPPEKQIVTAFPEVMTISIQEDLDEFLIVGCDGIWEFLSSQDVVSFVRERIDAANELSDILEELFDEILSPNPAIFEFGCDNMSAIIIDLRRRRGRKEENDGRNSSNNRERPQEEDVDKAAANVGSGETACSSVTLKEGDEISDEPGQQTPFVANGSMISQAARRVSLKLPRTRGLAHYRKPFSPVVPNEESPQSGLTQVTATNVVNTSHSSSAGDDVSDTPNGGDAGEAVNGKIDASNEELLAGLSPRTLRALEEVLQQWRGEEEGAGGVDEGEEEEDEDSEEKEEEGEENEQVIKGEPNNKEDG